MYKFKQYICNSEEYIYPYPLFYIDYLLVTPDKIIYFRDQSGRTL